MPDHTPAPQPSQNLPDGRTALMSMFPMHMNEPINGLQPPTQTENRPQPPPNALDTGK